MNRKRLIDVTTDVFGENGGIFAYLLSVPGGSDPPIPWGSDFSSGMLDYPYYYNVSGSKYISPLVEKFLGNDDTISASNMLNLARVIYYTNITRWVKLWNTLAFDYNPIENYSMREQMLDDIRSTEYGSKDERTENTTRSRDGSETLTPNVTETQTPHLKTDRDRGIFGFNSNEAVPSDTESEQATGTNTIVRTGTEKTEYDITDTDTGTVTNEKTGTDTETRNYTLTRAGNIGVTTSQQMIESERQLWMWHFFYDVVFPDVDKVLTIPIY